MARKPEGTNNAGSTLTPARAASTLKSHRSQIDKLDVQILKMVNERATLAAEIGKIKAEMGESVFAPAREDEVLQNVLEVHRKTRGVLGDVTIKAIFREIMSGARALQKILKVSYLGPQYSFCHLAAVEHFGHAVDLVSADSISAIFEEVNLGHVDFGVVPLENSTDGRIVDTLDMFLRMSHLVICAEVRLQVHHHLLAKCEPQAVQRVYSKPEALSQCRTWLNKNVPQARQVSVSSTSDAARLASTEPNAAAVASREASVHYGLRILFPDIQDSPFNETRFAVIGHVKCGRTGHDKTSLIFRLPHSPGALVTALDIFKQHKLNLTWIESFPARLQAKPEYVFFVDVEGHAEDAKVAKAVKALGEHCEQVTVLGSYPAAPLTE